MTRRQSQSAASAKKLYRNRLELFPVAARTTFLTEDRRVLKFFLWCVLLVLCWPLALAALVLYPLVWLLLLPFRIVGIAVGGALELVWAIVTLPARLLRAL